MSGLRQPNEDNVENITIKCSRAMAQAMIGNMPATPGATVAFELTDSPTPETLIPVKARPADRTASATDKSEVAYQRTLARIEGRPVLEPQSIGATAAANAQRQTAERKMSAVRAARPRVAYHLTPVGRNAAKVGKLQLSGAKAAVFGYLVKHAAKDGVMATYQQIADAVGIQSENTVDGAITGLKNFGLIVTKPVQI